MSVQEAGRLQPGQNNQPIKADKTKSLDMRKLSSRTALLLAAGLAVALYAAYAIVSRSGSAHGDKSAAVPVIVATVQMREVKIEERAVGTVLANATVQIKSRVDGQILTAGFTEGQIVHKGDLLFQIDKAPFEATLRAAQANLARDQAQLANARLVLGRASQLASKGYASQETRDAAAAQVKTLVGTVAADQAAIDQATLQLGYTEIRSPIDGKTGPLLIDAGNIIKAEDANPLVVISQIEPVKISFALAQQELPQLQQRLNEKALLASFKPRGGTREISAPVDFISNQVNADAGTIELRATYINHDFNLVPGEFVDVRVALNDVKNAITVPLNAVNTGQDNLYVYTISNQNTAELQKVDVLYRTSDAAVIAPGAVKPGDKVVTDGQMRLTPGAKVKFVASEPTE